MIKSLPVALLWILPALSGCNLVADRLEEEPEEEEIEVFHWAYDGENGPDSWFEHHAECGGDEQSPVDLATETLLAGEGPILSFNYGSTPLEAENNGHTVKFNVAGGSTLDIDGATFTLAQFHFHAQSEHTIDGEHFPAEVHFVHQNGSEYAVVSMFIVEGAEPHPWFADARWSELPTEEGDVLDDPATVLDLDDLILNQVQGEIPDYMHYTGSLTTPDCNQGVEWYVLGQYLELSADQLATFTAIYDHNYRPVQPMNARAAIYDEAYGL